MVGTVCKVTGHPCFKLICIFNCAYQLKEGCFFIFYAIFSIVLVIVDFFPTFEESEEYICLLVFIQYSDLFYEES